MKNKIRVVVIDDSAFMRKSLSIMLESDPDIEVVGTARDGEEGYELVKTAKPDIATLDIEMPKMDGLTSLKLIMKNCPTPVIMVSSLTTEGAEATIKAMEYGALDFIPKEQSFVNVNIIKIKEELIKKVREIVLQRRTSEKLRRLRTIRSSSSGELVTPKVSYGTNLPRMIYRSIGLGISTGGPMSLQKVIPRIKGNINVPMFIVQHMPPKFTKSLADRLDGMSELSVKEAENGELAEKNVVYIAPGGYHMTVKKDSVGTQKIVISEEPSTTLHRPSVDVMLNSVIDCYGKQTLGIIMTGMGKDGLEGITKLKNLGGVCMAQDEESCIVYGMPKAIVDHNFADAVVPLERIADKINGAF